MNEFKTICLNGLFKLLNSTRLESGNIGAKTNVFDYDLKLHPNISGTFTLIS